MGIKLDSFSSKQKKIPDEFKDLAKDFAEKGFITTSSDKTLSSSALVSKREDSTSWQEINIRWN